METARRTVCALNFCRLRYGRALDLQKHYAKRHLDSLAGVQHEHLPPKDILLYGDHEPVYTVGNRDERYTLQEEERLKVYGVVVRLDTHVCCPL